MATVVVVDDAATSRAWATRVLEAEGHHVISVEVLAAAAPLLPAADLVVLDWLLPGSSGIEWLRGLDQASCPPVVVLTALEDRRDAVLARQAGAAAFVRKTEGAEELLSAVRAALHGPAHHDG